MARQLKDVDELRLTAALVALDQAWSAVRAIDLRGYRAAPEIKFDLQALEDGVTLARRQVTDLLGRPVEEPDLLGGG